MNGIWGNIRMKFNLQADGDALVPNYKKEKHTCMVSFISPRLWAPIAVFFMHLTNLLYRTLVNYFFVPSFKVHKDVIWVWKSNSRDTTFTIPSQRGQQGVPYDVHTMNHTYHQIQEDDWIAEGWNPPPWQAISTATLKWTHYIGRLWPDYDCMREEHCSYSSWDGGGWSKKHYRWRWERNGLVADYVWSNFLTLP